jgi:hypothetical protein
LEQGSQSNYNSVLNLDGDCDPVECVANQSECVTRSKEKVCTLNANGCYYYQLADCPILPKTSYCINAVNHCQFFPVVNGHSVTFYYEHDTATTVKVVGNFNLQHPWEAQYATPMVENNNVFSVTVDNIPKGDYLYKFIVDNASTWTTDPLNPLEDSTPDHNSRFSITAD